MSARTNPEIALPYRFDTADVWRTILKGVFTIQALLILCILFAAVARQWTGVFGLSICEAMLFWFTRLIIKHQEGSIGTLHRDHIDVEPNILLGLSLPGPGGRYPLDRFASILVEFRSGPIQPGVQGGPNEVVWLKGKTGTPNIALAHVNSGAGVALAEQFADLLDLPVDKIGEPLEIRLSDIPN